MLVRGFTRSATSGRGTRAGPGGRGGLLRPARGCSTAASSSSQTGGAGDWRAPSRGSSTTATTTRPPSGSSATACAEVRRAVREEVRRGAHHIKVYLSGAVDSPSDRVDSTQFSMEELRRDRRGGDSRQHLRGRPRLHLPGHQPRPGAGVRSIEHGNLMDASSIPLFQEYGAFYVPTIVTYQALADRPAQGLLPADIAASWPGHRRRARSAGDGAQGRPADRLRHGPVRRHCTTSSCRNSSSGPRSSRRPT